MTEPPWGQRNPQQSWGNQQPGHVGPAQYPGPPQHPFQQQPGYVGPPQYPGAPQYPFQQQPGYVGPPQYPGAPQFPHHQQPKPKTHVLRWASLAAVLLLVVLGVVGALSQANTATTTSKSAAIGTSAGGTSGADTTTARATTTASEDVSGDFVIGDVGTDQFGGQYVSITVHNPTGKSSDFMATVDLDSADGKTQLDDNFIFVTDLEPGQSSVQQVSFINYDTIPAGANVVLKGMTRTASN